MSDMTSTADAKPKAVVLSMPAFEMPKFEMPKFEMPKFDVPNFEMPKMEIPAAMREFAEKGIAQSKANYEKMKGVAEDATEMLEDTFANASKGCAGYGLKMIEAARANSNAAYDLLAQLMTAKSYAEVVELTSAYMRAQFDTATTQAKELADHAQKVATETVEPIKEGFTTVFRKAA
jgi:phasin